MIRDKISEVNFFVDNYVNILEIESIELETVADHFYIAAVIGCIEGIIQINKDKDYLTFINMYKIKQSSSYKFMSIYSFIKKNKEYSEYIINYFNIWHGNKYEVFTYDEYNKKDLINNFYELATLLIEERELAKNCNDYEVFNNYNLFCSNLSSMLSGSVSF
ncbi:MAG: hypothetical protein K0R07_1360 [Sedimentibacter sp.]|jgi:hypothetical protein|nr:hypothetical protein [Sedimentibacter sp.]